MSGLPRVAVLGVDPPGAAATIALVDGGLAVTAFSAGPMPTPALAALAANGLADHVIEVAPGSLGLRPAGPEPTFAVFGVTADRSGAGDPGARPTAANLGVFEAVVLIEPTDGLSPGTAGAPRFGGVFDLDGRWIFHLGGPAELASAQARWVGEYLRGRYALPDRAEMAARPQLAARSRRGGVHGALAALERELRTGHARAAEAGYPLPAPPT